LDINLLCKLKVYVFYLQLFEIWSLLGRKFLKCSIKENYLVSFFFLTIEPDWAGSCYATQADLQLEIFLPLPQIQILKTPQIGWQFPEPFRSLRALTATWRALVLTLSFLCAYSNLSMIQHWSPHSSHCPWGGIIITYLGHKKGVTLDKEHC
jgi:hypothetical protein